jgi:endo-1,4-beta-xylanase
VLRPVAAHVALLVTFALVSTVADARVPASCGARKRQAIGRTCQRILEARARLHPGTDVVYVGLDTTLTEELARGWIRAERAGDAPCTVTTAPAAEAAAMLQRDAVLLEPTVTRAACRRRLLRLAGRACRALLRVAGDGAHATAAQRAAVGRVHARFAARWRAARCAGADDGVTVARALGRLAAGAAASAMTWPLHALAPEGVSIGTAVEPRPLADDPLYAATLVREFDSLTPENAMKWSSIHPEPERWDFAPADALVEFAERQGLRVRGTSLFWRYQLPRYVAALTDPSAARALLANHIAVLVGRYAGRVARWDVVNEPLTFSGRSWFTDGLDDNVMLRLLGPGYIAEALALAHAADPTARLYLNEVLVEFPGPKQDRFFRLVSDLLAAGAPLHGVGLQGHFGVFTPPVAPHHLEAAVRRFAALGLEVELTEIDVAISSGRGDLTARLAKQRDDYREIVNACLAVRGCRGITTWGISDRDSWIRVFGFEDHVLLFDDAFAAKPAYFGVRAALLDRRYAP